MDYLLVGLFAFALGAWFAKTAGSGNPLSLRAITRYEFTPPVRVAPLHRRAQWQMWTHRYITLAEVLERERGTRQGWLPGREMLEAKTGQTWRTFNVYRDLLAGAGVVEVVDRGGVRWLTGKADRRACLSALPFPLTKSPPRFNFTRSGRDSVTGATA